MRIHHNLTIYLLWEDAACHQLGSWRPHYLPKLRAFLIAHFFSIWRPMSEHRPTSEQGTRSSEVLINITSCFHVYGYWGVERGPMILHVSEKHELFANLTLALAMAAHNTLRQYAAPLLRRMLHNCDRPFIQYTKYVTITVTLLCFFILHDNLIIIIRLMMRWDSMG